MDGHEKALIGTYNAAIGKLKTIARGDPLYIPASREVLRAQRALTRYRRAKNN